MSARPATRRTATGRAAAFAPDGRVERVGLGGVETEVEWRRSARSRRISLRVDTPTGRVVVTLPTRAARSGGLLLLHAHAAWLRDRLDALPGQIRLAPGVMLPLGGIPHPVRHAPDRRGGCWIENGAILVSGAPEFVARRLADFLRAEARRRLGALVGPIAAVAELRPRRIALKDTRTRWGSCTADGTLMFNWRLVMAPDAVQHYVAAHEVAHLRHLDHGDAFWALVARLTPHRRAADLWLRDHGATLLRVG